jgi:putative FmdB family regulatory protein
MVDLSSRVDMAFRMQQFRCKKCKNEFEQLVNTSDVDPDKDVECPMISCMSQDVERILAVGSGKGGHISWSKWRV